MGFQILKNRERQLSVGSERALETRSQRKSSRGNPWPSMHIYAVHFMQPIFSAHRFDQWRVESSHTTHTVIDVLGLPRQSARAVHEKGKTKAM